MQRETRWAMTDSSASCWASAVILITWEIFYWQIFYVVSTGQCVSCGFLWHLFWRQPFPFHRGICKFTSTQIPFFFQNICLESERYQFPSFQVSPLYGAYDARGWAIPGVFYANRTRSSCSLTSAHCLLGSPLTRRHKTPPTSHVYKWADTSSTTSSCNIGDLLSFTGSQAGSYFKGEAKHISITLGCSLMLATRLSTWDMWLPEMAQRTPAVDFLGQL